MAVQVPAEGAEVRCALIGMDTDVEALVAHRDGTVRIEYSRPSASQVRRVHLVEQYAADDAGLQLVLGRLTVRRSRSGCRPA